MRVEETIRRVVSSGEPYVQSAYPPAFRRLGKAETEGRIGAHALQASFQTGEISVDTEQVANLVTKAVRVHDRIHLNLGCHVQSASHRDGGGVDVRWIHENRLVQNSYRYGINCTWEDRLRLDLSVGMAPARPWLMRWKAALTLHLKQPLSAAELPSMTLITGPFGDIVNHLTTKVYVSWYPLCKLAETRAIDGAALHALARPKCTPELADASVKALERFAPGIARAAREASSVSIGGGVIFAWGQTDIDDPKSGLHERHAIGATFQKDWASMDTGKYCMAPYYATALASVLSH